MTLTMSDIDKLEERLGDRHLVPELCAAARRSIDMDQRLCDLGVDPDHILPPPPSMASEVVPEGEPTPGIKSEPSGHRFKNGLEPLAPPPLESGEEMSDEEFEALDEKFSKPVADLLLSPDFPSPPASDVAGLCEQLREAPLPDWKTLVDLCNEAAAMLEAMDVALKQATLREGNARAKLELREREIERLKDVNLQQSLQVAAKLDDLEAYRAALEDIANPALSDREHPLSRIARAVLKGDRT